MRTCGSRLRIRRNGATDREVEPRVVDQVDRDEAEAARNILETYLEDQARA